MIKVIIRHVVSAWERQTIGKLCVLFRASFGSRSVSLVFSFIIQRRCSRIGVGNEERDIVSTARVCSTPVLRGGCNVARKNTVNSTATGPVCLPQKSAGRSRNMTTRVRGASRRLAASLAIFCVPLPSPALRDYDLWRMASEIYFRRQSNARVNAGSMFLNLSSSIERFLKIK